MVIGLVQKLGEEEESFLILNLLGIMFDHWDSKVRRIGISFLHLKKDHITFRHVHTLHTKTRDGKDVPTGLATTISKIMQENTIKLEEKYQRAKLVPKEFNDELTAK